MQIVNRRTHKPTPQDVYIGRPGLLGNPYRIGRDGGRVEVIAKYRVWLEQQIAAGGPVREAFDRLQPDSVLVCWCAPALCHGSVIASTYAQVRTPAQEAQG